MATNLLTSQNSDTEWVKSSSHSLNSQRERDIFSLGKERGAEEVRKEIQDLYLTHLTKSYEDTTRLLSYVKDLELDIISARLKVDSLTSLKVVIALKSDEKLLKSLDKLYNRLYDLEDEINSDEYDLRFSIIKANGESFSDKCVENDGYIYKHRLSLNEEEARPA